MFTKYGLVTPIAELLTTNDRSKCRSLRTIILFHQVGYDRDPSDILILLRLLLGHYGYMIMTIVHPIYGGWRRA